MTIVTTRYNLVNGGTLRKSTAVWLTCVFPFLVLWIIPKSQFFIHIADVVAVVATGVVSFIAPCLVFRAALIESPLAFRDEVRKDLLRMSITAFKPVHGSIATLQEEIRRWAKYAGREDPNLRKLLKGTNHNEIGSPSKQAPKKPLVLTKKGTVQWKLSKTDMTPKKISSAMKNSQIIRAKEKSNITRKRSNSTPNFPSQNYTANSDDEIDGIGTCSTLTSEWPDAVKAICRTFSKRLTRRISRSLPSTPKTYQRSPAAIGHKTYTSKAHSSSISWTSSSSDNQSSVSSSFLASYRNDSSGFSRSSSSSMSSSSYTSNGVVNYCSSEISESSEALLPSISLNSSGLTDGDVESSSCSSSTPHIIKTWRIMFPIEKIIEFHQQKKTGQEPSSTECDSDSYHLSNHSLLTGNDIDIPKVRIDHSDLIAISAPTIKVQFQEEKKNQNIQSDRLPLAELSALDLRAAADFDWSSSRGSPSCLSTDCIFTEEVNQAEILVMNNERYKDGSDGAEMITPRPVPSVISSTDNNFSLRITHPSASVASECDENDDGQWDLLNTWRSSASSSKSSSKTIQSRLRLVQSSICQDQTTSSDINSDWKNSALLTTPRPSKKDEQHLSGRFALPRRGILDRNGLEFCRPGSLNPPVAPNEGTKTNYLSIRTPSVSGSSECQSIRLFVGTERRSKTSRAAPIIPDNQVTTNARGISPSAISMAATPLERGLEHLRISVLNDFRAEIDAEVRELYQQKPDRNLDFESRRRRCISEFRHKDFNSSRIDSQRRNILTRSQLQRAGSWDDLPHIKINSSSPRMLDVNRNDVTDTGSGSGCNRSAVTRKNAFRLREIGRLKPVRRPLAPIVVPNGNVSSADDYNRSGTPCPDRNGADFQSRPKSSGMLKSVAFIDTEDEGLKQESKNEPNKLPTTERRRAASFRRQTLRKGTGMIKNNRIAFSSLQALEDADNDLPVLQVSPRGDKRKKTRMRTASRFRSTETMLCHGKGLREHAIWAGYSCVTAQMTGRTTFFGSLQYEKQYIILHQLKKGSAGAAFPVANTVDVQFMRRLNTVFGDQKDADATFWNNVTNNFEQLLAFFKDRLFVLPIRVVADPSAAVLNKIRKPMSNKNWRLNISPSTRTAKSEINFSNADMISEAKLPHPLVQKKRTKGERDAASLSLISGHKSTGKKINQFRRMATMNPFSSSAILNNTFSCQDEQEDVSSSTNNNKFSPRRIPSFTLAKPFTLRQSSPRSLYFPEPDLMQKRGRNVESIVNQLPTQTELTNDDEEGEEEEAHRISSPINSMLKSESSTSGATTTSGITSFACKDYPAAAKSKQALGFTRVKLRRVDVFPYECLKKRQHLLILVLIWAFTLVFPLSLCWDVYHRKAMATLPDMDMIVTAKSLTEAEVILVGDTHLIRAPRSNFYLDQIRYTYTVSAGRGNTRRYTLTPSHYSDWAGDNTYNNKISPFPDEWTAKNMSCGT